MLDRAVAADLIEIDPSGESGTIFTETPEIQPGLDLGAVEDVRRFPPPPSRNHQHRQEPARVDC